MRCPTLSELPAPPEGKTGWPWTEETPTWDSTELEGPAPRISIVIPSYNQALFVEETLRAILLQGYPDLELIFAEDASTDDTLEVIEPYRPWMTLLPAPANRGMSNAINRGFRRASGEIVTWISTDDVYLPGAFQQAARRWQQDPECGALIGGFRFVDPESAPLGPVHPARLEPKAPLDLTVAPLSSWRLHQVATFYTAAGLDSAGRYVREDLYYVMDRDLLFRIARLHPVHLIDRPLALFRLHPESKSASKAKMLAFAGEFANLQLAYLSGEPQLDRRRKRIARRRRAKGFLRHGGRGQGSGRGLSLLRAAALAPSFLLHRTYWVRWLDLLGLGGLLRRALGRSEALERAL